MRKKMMGIVLLMVVLSLVMSSCQSSTTSTTEGEEVNLKWYAMGTRQPDHDRVLEEFNQQLQEKMGVKLDFELIDAANYQNKINLIMTSGEVYDLLFTSNWLNNFNLIAAKGALAPLDDLIEQYGQGLKETLPEYLFSAMKYNGQIYAIPNYQIEYTLNGFSVQKDLAEKYDLDPESIKEVQDIEPFLAKVKEGEPSLYPIQEKFGFGGYDTISGTFTQYRYTEENPQIQSQFDLDFELNALKNDWFKKGYIRPDVLSVTDDTADFNSNRYAVLWQTIKPGLEANMITKTGKEYINIPIGEPFLASTAGQSSATAISAASPNKEKAMEFINLINTDKELFNLLMFGFEGEHFEKISDDTIRIFDDTKYKLGISAWAFGNQFNAYYTEGQENNIWQLTDQLNREAVPSTLLGFTPNLEPIKTKIAQIETINKEFAYSYIYDDWQARLEQRNEQLELAGMADVVSEVQQQVDEWIKNP